MKKRHKILLGLLATLAIVYVAVIIIVPPILDENMNGLQSNLPERTATAKADSIYNNLDFIADLHSDALLWGRDLSIRNDVGQVDIPRLHAGQMNLQVFTVVSKSPAGLNFDSNSADALDNITLASIAQAKPIKTWFSLKERALNQGRQLKELEDNPKNNFKIIRSVEDLQEVNRINANGKKMTSGIFGLEGMHVLEGKFENLQVMYDAGIRMAGFVHFFDNELGGSAQGVDKGGITDFGLKVLKACEEKGIIIDLAHSSQALFFDVIKHSTKPLLVSHTGTVGPNNCLPTRNLTDTQIQAVADKGGIIGVAYLEALICGNKISTIANHMKHIRDLVGAEHVALGSDADGAMATLLSLEQQPVLIDELLKLGFTEAEIEAVMGGNVERFLLANLPSRN